MIDLESEHLAISTAGCPQVYKAIDTVVFKRVSKDFDCVDLERYCAEIARSVGVDLSRSTIFLTAVDVSSYSYAEAVYNGVRSEVFITYGVDSPSCIEMGDKEQYFNTINIAVITSKPLSPLGLLDLYRLVSEVKGAIMSLAGPLCRDKPSIGTASDATAVVAPVGDNRFAGIATDVGMATAAALAKAMSRYFKGLGPGDYVAQTLALNSFEELVDMAIDVYRRAPIPGLGEAEAREIIRRELITVLSDPNLVLLIRISRYADPLLSLNLFPGIGLDEYRLDSQGIVVDEAVGKAVAEYVNGFKGLLAYYWVERLKESGRGLEKLRDLPPVADDIVSALIGATLSRVYDRYSRRG